MPSANHTSGLNGGTYTSQSKWNGQDLGVRCWPIAASELRIFSVGFGEILWF